MEETTNQQSYEQSNPYFKPDAPNAMAILILGIVSLVLIFILSCLGIGFLGFITSIVGFILAISAQKEIAANPDRYSEKSIKNIKVGKILNLIGLIIGIISIVLGILILVAGGFSALMQNL